MALEQIDRISQSIFELNGMIGNPTDYLNIAWTGLRKSFDGLPEIREQLVPNDAEMAILNQNFSDNVLTNENRPFKTCN